MIGSLPTEMEETEEISTSTTEWRMVSDPKQAGWFFSQELLHSNRDSNSLFLRVDIRQDKEEQDRALVTFYNRDNVQWTSPLQCKLQGDVATGSGVDRHMMSTVIFKLISGFHINLGSAAIVKIFEGEPDHLIPSVSDELLDNNMFTVAGRMIGHSFLHHGPSFPGLSPAITHILFGGSLETTPVTVQDCPDLDIRDTMKMLDGDAELKEFDSIHQLCLSWDLPAPNATNRKWLSEKLLLHAVIGQTRRQIYQFRKGLKETGLWPLLIQRRDIIPILFPRESEAQVTPQMLLDCIIWPSSITVTFESYEVKDEDESDAIDVSRVSGYLKTFIDNASPAELKSLVKFWIGWEVPATEMKVEIVEATFPTAATCFEKLRLPRHHTAYKTFHQDLCTCISTSYSGFGCA
ncbi:G2/M phase-specific E3 ubiquitin-protein ligase-like [Dicentrarchus labrax]|uniref:G2/M phase-specific E3 ubiquitin-protein ligase-like n=1 Tax=Dicentrarchus labrax TaxID=13489 RepID=UPI0021F50621|nr:G2/M phase-specific E3 ubiquitin-protein ligase-like [Dicentrarchus labrax]